PSLISMYPPDAAPLYYNSNISCSCNPSPPHFYTLSLHDALPISPARIQGAASPFMMTGVSSVIEYSLYTYRLNNSQKFSPSSREYQYDLFRNSYSSLLGCFLFQPSCTTPSLTSLFDRLAFCWWTLWPHH